MMYNTSSIRYCTRTYVTYLSHHAQDLSVALQSLLVAASRDGRDARYTVQEIYQVVSALAIVGELVSVFCDIYPSLPCVHLCFLVKDAFSALPVLLPCGQEGVDELLLDIGDKCNPKETVIALQEYAEKLTNRLSYTGESEGSDEEDSGACQKSTTTQQLVRILQLYSKGTAIKANSEPCLKVSA